MSIIKLEFPNTPNNIAAAVIFLSAISGEPAEVKTMEVIDAEEVKAPAKKTPAPRPSRAKAKPEPEPEEEEEETDPDFEEEEEEEEEETEDEDITEDTLRELSAKKIGKHKEAIIAELAKFKVKGWANLPEKHYAHMQAFLTKLK